MRVTGVGCSPTRSTTAELTPISVRAASCAPNRFGPPRSRADVFAQFFLLVRARSESDDYPPRHGAYGNFLTDLRPAQTPHDDAHPTVTLIRANQSQCAYFAMLP